MERRTFEANLKRAIDMSPMNKAEVARRVGVVASTLTRWTDSNEGRDISAQHLLSLSRVLGVDPWVLFGSTFAEPLPPAPAPRRGRPPVKREEMDAGLERGVTKRTAPPSSPATPPRTDPKRGRA